VALVERQCCFDDGWRRAVAAPLPGTGVDLCITRSEGQDLLNHPAQPSDVAPNWGEEFVVLRGCGSCERHGSGTGGDQDRRNDNVAAGFMKVLEVERVVTNLIKRGRCELCVANLEFKDEDDWADQKNNVDSFAHARD